MNKETVADAYVEAKDKVLNPEALSSTLLERMPTPTGWRLLILPYKGKGKTEGGIYLPDQCCRRKYCINTGWVCIKGWRLSF